MVVQKRHLFELTPEESEASSSLVAWASKLPAPARTGNEYHDDDMKMKRDAFVKIIDKLWRNPGIVMQAANWIENRAKSQACRDTARFFESIGQLRNLDETWACSYLSGKCNFSISVLEQATAADPDAWRQLLQYGLVAGPSLKLPKECREKEVMHMTLTRRMEACGNRLLPFNEANLLGDHGIDWGKNGVYEVIFDESTARATSILHRPTGDHGKVPEHVVISTKFELDQNWSDYHATVGLKPTSYVIADDFFKDRCGPHQIKLMTGTCKEFDDMAASVKQTMLKEEQAREKMTHTPSKAFRSEAKAAAKKENMQKARQKLHEKKLALNNKRKIKLVAS
jgi:hypothetical protein